MPRLDFSNDPHRRLNPLTGEWVLVSPHRTKRPWQGQVEKPAAEERPAYDPGCYLCPGNERAGGVRNPAYESTFVFRNDFSALLPSNGDGSSEPEADLPLPPPSGRRGILQYESAAGECRVLCFSPRHDLTLAKMPSEAIVSVVDMWADQALELGERYKWVQIFENRGAAMGASNPHPHGQVWASDFVPSLVALEGVRQAEYFRQTGSVLLLDVVEEEIGRGERVVEVNDDWVLIVPFWAVWPFEYLLMPRRPVSQLYELTASERASLAAILKAGLQRYDRLFDTDFPYSMGWHPAPPEAVGGQLHAHFYPPLLRSATVRKFMVGYEMLAEAQRDLTAEQAAERLRNVRFV